MSKHRCSFQIKLDTLLAVSRHAKHSNIAASAGLNHPFTEKYLEELVTRGLVEKYDNPATRNRQTPYLYKVTQTGIKALRLYNDFCRLIGEPVKTIGTH